MVTRKKSIVAPTTDTVSIHDACLKYMTTEQSLRLALSHVRPDDFDTVKAISEADLEAIAPHFQPKLPSNTLELPENLQNSTQQEPDQVSESNLQVSKATQNLTSHTQPPISNAQLSLIEQLTKQAEQEIQLVDAISQVKNQIILNNLAVRESELTEQVNQRWLNQKQGYLGSIRGLADLAQQKPEISTDDTNLTQEIDQILGDLEKKLIV
jgi:hypothetical protein